MNASERAIDYHKRWREAEADAEALAEALERIAALSLSTTSGDMNYARLLAANAVARYRGEK